MHPSASQIISLYERHAAAFDRLRQKDGVEKTWLERFRAVARAGATVDCFGVPRLRDFSP